MSERCIQNVGPGEQLLKIEDTFLCIVYFVLRCLYLTVNKCVQKSVQLLLQTSTKYKKSGCLGINFEMVAVIYFF